MILALLIACGGPSTSAPVDGTAPPKPAWGAAKATQSGKYQVAVEAVPAEIPMGELFAMQATVTDPTGAPVERAKVKLDARMPQHNHGMETEPKMEPGACVPAPDTDAPPVCTWAGGVYVAKGFKFHMAGAWTVNVDVDGPVGLDSTSFVVELK